MLRCLFRDFIRRQRRGQLHPEWQIVDRQGLQVWQVIRYRLRRYAVRRAIASQRHLRPRPRRDIHSRPVEAKGRLAVQHIHRQNVLDLKKYRAGDFKISAVNRHGRRCRTRRLQQQAAWQCATAACRVTCRQLEDLERAENRRRHVHHR